ncbi:MAG: hypothetical protein A3A82_01895 [Candidatus Pacebacteria bacterium RIFCSPLOWO2_01_FULL_47_12]|nr:MAG: hypothetical protein A3A82_01895 [Candidatus Pacebacteria bacterium RIFCSPLOWO2_01_FULL_47_12]
MEIGAENNSGWKWEDVAKYSNRTAASDPVAIACKGWLGGIGRESSVLPITRRLGKAWGGVSEPCVQRGDPITFAFTITDADAVPPEVRLHTYKTNNKYGSPDGWWGIFWSRYIVWLEPGANLGGSVIADIPDRLLHGCTMNKSDAFTWIFDCLAPTSDEYERDPNDPDTIQTNYGTHSVVFSNQYNVETEVTYELAETCPILPGTPTDLTASCQAADTMRLSWTAVPEATMYRVHVDDGVLGDTIAAVGYGDDNTCLAPYDTLDTCVYTSNIYLDVQVADAATFDQANWSVFAVNDDGMSEESAVSVLKSCIPNCRDIEGPPSVTQGDTALYSAIFESAHGFLGGTFSVKGITDTSYSADMQWPSRNFGDATILTQRSDGVFSWDTTGVEPGRYNLYCRAWNDGKAECIGDSTTIPTPPVYACAGGVSSMEVEVLPPEITISGTMYEGLGSGISGDLCVAPATPADGTPWNGDERSFWIGMDGLVPMPGTFPYLWRVGADGVYSISGVQSDSGVATVKARAFDLPDGYQFVCPANGQYSISTDGVTEDITGVNFFISQIGDPWWQARGGLVYSRWTVSNLPISASTGDPLTACANAGSDCTPYLVTGLLSGIAESAGLPLGPTTIPAGYGTNHPGDYGLVNDHTDAGLARENYAVLSRRFDLAAAQQITADTIAVAPSGAALQSDAEVYFSDHNLAIFLSGNWSISNADNDRKVVLFVDGDVVLTNTATESIKVPEGNFFAIIASGNITFSSDVGIPVTPGDTAAMYSLETEYEGVFIADGILTIDAYTDDSYAERKFIGAGSFVGWSGVNLPRNFEAEGVPLSGTLNNSVPTDTFIFRPDFILNTPELMKRSTFNWREINSITQE